MNCKICNHNSEKIFDKKILLKYDVSYHRCTYCGFIQTDEPFWLQEAYGNAITSLDIGILDRNKLLLAEIPKIIDVCFPEAQTFLDFAGGYGIFVRSMRDLGYNFFRQDIYCENIFAKHFDLEDSEIQHFDIVTAFEVFEHLESPLSEIEKIFEFSDNLIFSTETVPTSKPVDEWVYIAHETGQHIAFYSEKSLEIIAEKFGKRYYRKKNIHIYTPQVLSEEQINFAINDIDTYEKYFGLKTKKITKFEIIRESYQQRDYIKIKNILYKNV